MSILEILKLEEENGKGIFLHREGLFWRAYEQSAYRFVKYINPYKVIKKLNKGVKKEIVYLGFPHNIINEILNQNSNKKINQTDTTIEITEFETEYNDFIEWKNNIYIFKPEPVIVNEKAGTYNKPDLIEKLRRFPVMNKTPLECQIFLNDLQNQLNGNV